MTTPMPTAAGARIAAAVQPVVAQAGYDLEHVSVRRVGRRSVVRVVVDGEHGISLDDVAAVSRVISDTLDQAPVEGGPIGLGPYTLEVTSPGVDRPLSLPRHWRRAVGRLVRTRIADRPVEGRVVSVDDQGVGLEVAGIVLAAPYSDLAPGSVQVEFVKGVPE